MLVPDHVYHSMSVLSIQVDSQHSPHTEASSSPRFRTTKARWLRRLHKVTLGLLLGTTLSGSGGLAHNANIEVSAASTHATITVADSTFASGMHVLGQPRAATALSDTVTSPASTQHTGPSTTYRTFIPLTSKPTQSPSPTQNPTPARRTDNGDLVIDNLESTFTWVGELFDAACGIENHSNWSWASNESDGITNDVAAVWRPTIPQTGQYRVLAHIPSCSTVTNLTTDARYEIVHASGKANVTINQSTQRGWVDLGTFGFTTGTSGYVGLTDLTSESFYVKRAIMFDAIQWVPLNQSVSSTIDLSKYPTEYAANSGYVYTGRRAQVLHYVQAQFGTRVTTYASHSECPTCSADLWTPDARGGVDNTGLQSMNELAEYLRANVSALGIKYIIWNQRLSSGSTWQEMPDRGSITANHKDHVHITFLDTFN